MQQLRRFVQFCLGIQAAALVVSIVVVFYTIVAMRQAVDGEEVPLVSFALMVTAAMMLPLLNIVPAIAWWKLKKGKRSARRWILAASILDILILAAGIESWFFFGSAGAWPFYALSGTIGILGLIAFLRKDLSSAEVRARKLTRVAGDGASQSKDYTSQFVSFGIVWISFRLWHQWGEAQGLAQPGFMVGMILFQLAVMFNTCGHETGHLFAGWASGMILRRFQVGPFQFAIRNGRWEFHILLNQFYGGAVGMVTPTLKNIRGREAFMILGGPVASLAVGAMTTAAVLAAKGHFWEPYWTFLSMCASLGWASFVTNLIPLKSAASYSDGAQLHQLITNGEWAHFHIAFAMVASSSVTSVRARDLNVATINRAADFITQGERGLLLRLFAGIHYLDAGQIPEALHSMQAAEALYDQSTFEKPQDICAEFVFMNAFFKEDLAAAELWWKRIEGLRRIDRDADYWRARAALLLLKGERQQAREAWECGNALARKLPATGVYESTRSCFARLRVALDEPLPPAPPPLKPLNALAAVEA